ncbi:FtsK/SpoIIIE domain-containing protein [Terrabacter sp. MAHUQ-38]|uniref:FtsK/SpoIIIE domain-containing protein n=1 Tax=unclassified Terrabacter TaxID=2630222 RepID=UPI00165E26F9|nr:FtsK/SpoIIIE domain-containing protein [Terrabacter sp. MAHUQ-38]MBC9822552.1 cell division protein FtsK [Terrabacter sp. MAHUQ-38]
MNRVPAHGWAVIWGVVVWTWRHLRWTVLVAAVAFAVRMLPDGQALAIRLLVIGWWVPAVVASVWSHWWPTSYQRLIAGPAARVSWMWWARRRWPHLARECGLSVHRDQRPSVVDQVVAEVSKKPAPPARKVWMHPRLCSVTAKGVTLTVTVRARTGQTVDDLEHAAPALAAAASARSFRFRALSPSTGEYVLVMADRLGATRDATAPTSSSAHVRVEARVDAVPVGRRQDGTPWMLPVTGRHTLVVGCSGSGKGSVFWGVCGGLAPAVSAGLVRLWGVDLKRGVEVGMGRGLFSEVAITPGQAVDVLTRLLAVVDERGRRMAGTSRLHRPTPTEPLHVLAIDELAVLTAYADPETRKEAGRLLAEVLTQGRALGVVVLACVQDPRKEVIGLRGLFTQTIALRLRSADETRMVLGDGTAATAPAHRISSSAPGTAWVIEEDGSADRVRADFWPDTLVRDIAARHRAPHPTHDTTEAREPVDLGHVDAIPYVPGAPEDSSDTDESTGDPRPRKPRAPRKPRQPRATTSAASVTSVPSAAERGLGGDAA